MIKTKAKKKKFKKIKKNKNITLDEIKKRYDTIKHTKLDIRPTVENTFRLNWWYDKEKENKYRTNPYIIKSLVIKIIKNDIKEFPELGFDKTDFLK